MEFRPTILLTGFGPFPGTEINASARFAAALAKRARPQRKQTRIFHRVLPTQWLQAPSVLQKIRNDKKPDVLLHFGVSKNAQSFVIEKVARNHCENCRDANGELPNSTTIITDAPTELKPSFPTTEIIEQLGAREIPATLSQDAGAYLCNSIFYQSIFNSRTSADHPAHIEPIVGFVHLPVDLGEKSCALSWRTALIGGQIILNACKTAAKAQVASQI